MNPSLLSYFKHLMGFDVSMAKSFYETCLAATKQYYCMDIDCLKSVIVKDGKGINESHVYGEIMDLPVVSFSTHGEPVGGRNRHLRTATEHSQRSHLHLDRLV